MKRFLVSCLIPLLIGCGSKRLSSTMTSVTNSPRDEVFECAKDRVEDMGFYTKSIDKGDKRLVVRRVNENIRRSENTFRRALDQLTIEVAGRSEGGATLSVVAQTLLEYTGRRGPTFERYETSAMADITAQSVGRECAPEGESEQP